MKEQKFKAVYMRVSLKVQKVQKEGRKKKSADEYNAGHLNPGKRDGSVRRM